jgi:uncharacterized protein YjdB
MKNKLHVLLLSSALVLSLGMAAGCKKDNTPSENPPIEVQKNIAKVAITSEDIDPTEEKPIVLDNKSIVLKAKVTAIDETKDYSKKVTWASSDETVATVKNGTVSILSVSETKEVTITATSEEDTEKKASITLQVVHSPVDFEKSAPYGGIDDSMFVDDGILTVEDSSAYPHLVSADAKGTKFYFEAEIKATAFADDENWAKFGLIVTDNETGLWTGDDASADIKSLFFYCDANRNNIASGWTQFNTVANNDTFKGWEWSRTLGGKAVAEKPVKVGEFVKMGILRNGTQYIYYLEKEGVMTPVANVEYPDIAADETAYVMVAGFKTAMEVKGFNGVVGDAVDSKFETPTSIEITSPAQELYLGDTYQLGYKLDTFAYDRSLVTFESSNEEVATVDEKGLVTAKDVAGKTTLTVKYGQLSASVEFTVTDDPAAKVVLDGKMDDKVWEKAKLKDPVQIKWTDKSYVNFYGSRNKKGLYVYADYNMETVKGPHDNNWWENDNFEFHIKDEKLTNVDGTRDGNGGQFWACTGKPGNNCDASSFITSMIEQEDGTYHADFELFISYEKLGGDINTVYAVEFGSNPAAGWKTVSFWGAANIDAYAKFGTEGFNFDHVDTAEEKQMKAVEATENLLTENMIVDNYNAAGWNNAELEKYPLTNLTGNYLAQITYDMESNVDVTATGDAIGGQVWKHVLPIVRNSDGDCWVMRLDWWGWNDDANGDGLAVTKIPGNVNDSAAIDRTSGWCDFNTEILKVLQKSTIKATYFKVGSRMDIRFDIIATNLENKAFVYRTWATQLQDDPEKALNLGLTAEFAKATITSAKFLALED